MMCSQPLYFMQTLPETWFSEVKKGLGGLGAAAPAWFPGEQRAAPTRAGHFSAAIQEAFVSSDS